MITFEFTAGDVNVEPCILGGEAFNIECPFVLRIPTSIVDMETLRSLQRRIVQAVKKMVEELNQL